MRYIIQSNTIWGRSHQSLMGEMHIIWWEKHLRSRKMEELILVPCKRYNYPSLHWNTMSLWLNYHTRFEIQQICENQIELFRLIWCFLIQPGRCLHKVIFSICLSVFFEIRLQNTLCSLSTNGAQNTKYKYKTRFGKNKKLPKDKWCWNYGINLSSQNRWCQGCHQTL